MRILYLSHCCPYPPNKGDKIRAYHEIRHLAGRHEVHLACVTRDAKDLEHYNHLTSICRSVKIVPINERRAKIASLPSLLTPLPLSVPFFYRRELQDHINDLLATETFDAIVCFSSPMAEYVFRAIKPTRNFLLNGSRPRLIMDFCDLDSDKWLQYAGSSSWPANWIYGREGKELLAYERRVNHCFDHSVFISPPEVDLFRCRCPRAANLSVVANGVDFDYFYPGAVPFAAITELQLPTDPCILFTGAMDYQANIDGVVWFCERIYPLIRQVVPDLRFFIVGSRPTPDIKKLHGCDGITVTGFVDDIRPYYEAATLAVVPLRLARGVQNKILEALAMEKPVVSTSLALEGIAAEPNRDLLVADEPQAFALRVIDLLSQPAERTRLGLNGRRFVKQRHSWDDNMSKLEQLVVGRNYGT